MGEMSSTSHFIRVSSRVISRFLTLRFITQDEGDMNSSRRKNPRNQINAGNPATLRGDLTMVGNVK